MRIAGEVALPFLGAGYGAILGFLAFLSAGFGHGTYVFVGLSSAPAGVFGIPAALFGGPLIWAGIGFLLSRLTYTGYRRFFLAVLLGHYLSGFVLILTPTYGDWQYVARVLESIPWVIPLWLLVYLGGQTAIWLTYAVAMKGGARTG